MEELAMNGGPRTRDTAVKPWPSVGDASGRMFGREEIELLEQVIHSGCLFRYGGTMVDAFEAEVAEKYGVKHALAVTSGSAALHTAVAALDLDVGDEIITTTVTDAGTIISILQCNCVPTFADVDRRTMILRPDSIERALSDRTRAIIAVHLFGQPAPMDEIMALAARRDLYVLEDCAQAHGARFDGKLVGTLGHLGAFSMQQSKQVSTGDGGIVIASDDLLAARARMFHDKYYDRRGEYRGYERLGINYRMNELTGAVALAQIRKMDEILARRRASAGHLLDRLRGIDGIVPPWIHPRAEHAWWILNFQIDEAALGCTTDEFAAAIQAEGLPFGTGYAGGIPICMYPFLAERRAYGKGHFPWEPPYGRDVRYREEDYPDTYWAQANTFITNWNEGFTVDDAEDIARGIEKVAHHFRARL
jgi:dTDP-4-amino-4,6-dideoxygalactose transaminase